jgi:sRNA-binding regulator protein Hfq
MMNNQDARPTLSMGKQHARPTPKPYANKPRLAGGSKPQQHEKDLKRYKEGDFIVHITMMNGELVEGKIIGGDKYSIKMILEGRNNFETTLFKHAIESFEIKYLY